jgi:hypothetical protein
MYLSIVRGREATISNIYEYLHNLAFDLKSKGFKKADVNSTIIKEIVNNFDLRMSLVLQAKFELYVMYYFNQALNNCTTVAPKITQIAPVIESVIEPEVNEVIESEPVIVPELEKIELSDKKYDEELMKFLGIVDHD